MRNVRNVRKSRTTRNARVERNVRNVRNMRSRLATGPSRTYATPQVDIESSLAHTRAFAACRLPITDYRLRVCEAHGAALRINESSCNVPRDGGDPLPWTSCAEPPLVDRAGREL